MKQILMALLLLVSLTATSQNQYNIQGTAVGHDGLKVLLSNEKKQPIDSTIVSNGKFNMSNKLTLVGPAYLKIGRTNKVFMLDEFPTQVTYVETPIDIKGKTIMRPDITIKGSKDQELLNKMNNALSMEMMSMLALSMAGKEITEQQKDTLQQLFITTHKEKLSVFDSIATQCPDSYVAGVIINKYLSKDRTYPEVQKLYNQLSNRVKNSSIGTDLQETLAKMKAVGVGVKAPDFTLQTPEGKSVSLSSIKGKCVLIDFWASWCAPCIREFPNVKAVYAEYHSKGFEIVSVSLDQKKENWTTAIKKYNLPWLQLSSLQGWKCPVARLYNVSGVPAMFLLDENGVIVSKDLRGEKLKIEVSKLCDK